MLGRVKIVTLSFCLLSLAACGQQGSFGEVAMVEPVAGQGVQSVDAQDALARGQATETSMSQGAVPAQVGFEETLPAARSVPTHPSAAQDPVVINELSIPIPGVSTDGHVSQSVAQESPVSNQVSSQSNPGVLVSTDVVPRACTEAEIDSLNADNSLRLSCVIPQPVNLSVTSFRGSAGFKNCVYASFNGGDYVSLGCNKDGDIHGKKTLVKAFPAPYKNLVRLALYSNGTLNHHTGSTDQMKYFKFVDKGENKLFVGFEDLTDFDYDDFEMIIDGGRDVRFAIENRGK